MSDLELKTNFYTISETNGVTGHRGEMIEPSICSDERLVARKGPGGRYAIRTQYADTDINGPGGSMHPFNFVRRINDWWLNYPDYQFTLLEVREQFADFKKRYSANGSRFTA